MRNFVLVGAALVWLGLIAGPVSAAQVPISVFPNPIDFGTVPENSSTLLSNIFVFNSSNNTVTVTGMTLSGTNSGDFALVNPCIGAISGGQSCQMGMQFTPPAMGNRTASMVISFKGVGSPVTIPVEGIGGNPIPTITSTSPSSAYAGGPGFTLTVNGTGFLPSTTGSFNNNLRTTTYVSGTQIKIAVLASDITGTEQYGDLNVNNPAPGGGSFGWNFPVVSTIPTLGGIAPTSVVAGTGATALIVNGNNFASGATVLWNGQSRPTTLLPSGQLQAQLTAADLSQAQIAHVAVSNPSPGGVSSTLNFEVSYPAKILTVGIPANDLIWDPYTRRIYATVPSSYGANGNSIAVINPSTGAIESYHFAGSEPSQLTLSDDGGYIYTGLNGSGSLQRLVLPGFMPDINVSLGSQQFGGVNTAADLKVVPGSPHTVATVLGGGCCGQGGPLEFFTDSTLLPNSITSQGFTSVQFADASALYGYENGTLTQIAVDGNGGTAGQQWSGLLTCNGPIEYLNGLVYGPGGQVFNVQTGTLLGTYDVSCVSNNSPVLPSGAVNRTFTLQSANNSNLQVSSYDLSHFTPLSGVNLSELIGTGSNLIRWGADGLAFIYQNGCCGNSSTQVVLVRSPMVLPVSSKPNPVPVLSGLAPKSATHGSGNLRLTLTGTGFVPGSTVTWNGKQRYSDYVSSKQLTVYVPGSDLTTAGTASVVVKNPAPHGGVSNAVTFTIN